MTFLRSMSGLRRGLLPISVSVLFGCGGTLDAGADLPGEPLPVGRENPVILTNDGASDNWHGEYALLLAHAGGPPVAGIVVSSGGMWSDLETNFSGWADLVSRARQSGLTDVPDPLRSEGRPLERPSSGELDATAPNDSAGARFIIETSAALAEPNRPVVVATGGRLTDVADAYLIDPTVAERVVVVASLGTGFNDERLAHAGIPNGELDTWASVIVAQRFRYVQVSAYYDQTGDFPEERLTELPSNPFCDRIRAKQPDLLETPLAADQVSVLALGVSEFVTDVERVSFASFDGGVPSLAPDANGNAWLVSGSDRAAVTARIEGILSDPATFAE